MAHQAKVVDVKEIADGILAVKARCCGNKTTDSVLSLHELSRSDEEIDSDIQRHLAAVEKKHADRERAKQHIQRLITK